MNKPVYYFLQFKLDDMEWADFPDLIAYSTLNLARKGRKEKLKSMGIDTLKIRIVGVFETKE